MKSIISLAPFVLLGGIFVQSVNAAQCTFPAAPSPEFIDNRNGLASSTHADLPATTTMVRIVVDPAVHQCREYWYPLLGKFLTFNGPTAFYLFDVDTAGAKQASMLLVAYLRGEGVAIETDDVESGSVPGTIDYGIIKTLRQKN